MKKVNVHEAKSQLSSLIAAAEAGEEVVISRANKPAARLVAYERPRTARRLGEAKGLVTIHDDFEELPEELLAAFE